LVILEDNISNKSYLIKNDKGKEILSVFDRLTHPNNFSPTPELNSLSGLFDLTNNLSFATDSKTINSLVDLGIKRSHLDFLNIIYNEKYKLLLEKWIKSRKEDKLSIINGCLFVVNDLDLFLKGIRRKGYNINGGPKKYRTELNAQKSFLSAIDMDFRESLYNHNNYHAMKGYIPENYYLPREKFSYKNIHMDISSRELNI
jgi:hypothetical protein